MATSMGGKERLKTFIITVIAVGFIGAGGMLLWASTLTIPDLQSFEQRRVAQSTKIYDRTGEVLLYDVHENVRRTVIPFEDMSVHVKNATVALEDAEFYEHFGIKPAAIVRAVVVNVLSLSFEQGGSTITQQVVKNSLLTPRKTITRKLKEWVLAIKLERQLSKEQILELYLNEVPYGGNLYGIEEASQAYFAKSAADLTLAEAAYLASLPKAPTFYSPYGNNREALENRKNFALQQMLENGFITEEEYEQARAEEVAFQPRADVGIRAPHFVIFVRELLAEKYGERVLEEGGLHVITTLDYELQQKAQEVLHERALENEETFNAENAALVAIDPKTGQVLAMVGSRDYFDEEIDGNFNVALAHRQPGSSFKPFVYATALNKGFTPETVVFDVKTQFSTACAPSDLSNENPCYAPSNYDNVFRGPVTFREALAQSINVPAVKVFYLAGLENARGLAENMGITSLADINRYGLTLVLGGGEVSLLDMASAYSVFANDGMRNPYAAILEVKDANGNAIETFQENPQRVLPQNTARQINDMLSDNEARTPAFGANSPLHFPGYNVAAKTGTTNDYKDAWIIGYTPDIVVGTWAGNNDNTSMEKRVAGFVVAPMWHEVMEFALSQYPNNDFLTPANTVQVENMSPMLRGFWQGGESYFVDRLTGKRATENTPSSLREERVITNVHTILYWIDKDNPAGPPPRNPESDPQYVRWEYAVQQWKAAQGINDEDESVIPDTTDDVHLPAYAPRIAITSPTQNQTYQAEDRVLVSLETTGRFPFAEAEFYINGTYIGRATEAPFSISFIPKEIKGIEEHNTLRVVGYDNVQNKSEEEMSFEVSGL